MSKKTKKENNNEVRFERVELLNALKLAQMVAAKNSPKQTTECALLAIRGNECSVRATDLEVAIEKKIACRSEINEKLFEAALPCAELYRAVSQADDDEIVIRHMKEHNEIITMDGVYRFNAIDPALFPDGMFGFNVDGGIEMKIAELQEAAGKVVCALDASASSRYALNGVLWDKGISMVATNGRHLAKTVLKKETSKVQTNKRQIISKRTVVLLSHIEADEDEVCKVELGENGIFIKTDKLYITGPLIDGNFPKYEEVIPAGCEHSVYFDAERVIRQVRRAKILEGDYENEKNIIISSETGCVIFDSENQKLGTASMKIPIESDTKNGADDFEIAVKSKHFLAALKTLEKFRLEVTDSDKPLVLTDDETTHVIMPVSGI